MMGAMQRLIILAVALLALAPAPSGRTAAQTPENACAVAVFTASGGTSIKLATLTVALPPGHSYGWTPTTAPGGIHVSICVIEYQSQVVINASTGAEYSRSVQHAAAGPVLDQIAAGASVQSLPGAITVVTRSANGSPPAASAATATPVLAATATPAVAGSAPPPQPAAADPSTPLPPQASAGPSSIRPPSTGDAGLH